MIMSQQPSKPLAIFDGFRRDFCEPWRIFGNPKRPVAQRLVRPELIVIFHICLHYVVQ